MKILVFALSIIVNIFVMAAESPAVAATTTTNPNVTNSKSHQFEDLLINGQHHFIDDSVSTVEADKVFDSLIGVRTDFKDRLQESATNK